MFQICFTMCQVPEISPYTVDAVVYCAQIVLAVNNLNEIHCCLEKQPGEEEEEEDVTPELLNMIEIKPDTTQTPSQP